MTQLPLARHFGPDSVVARRHGAVMTMRQMLGDVAALAGALPDRRYVINLCDDRYQFLTGVAAAMVRGQVSLLPSARTPHALRELADGYPRLYCLCESPEGIPDGLEIVLHQISESVPSNAMPEFPADQLAVIVFTSGSTGQARPNPKSWGSLVHGATIAATRFGLMPERPGNIVGTVPPQHMYGFETTVLLPLQTGYAFHSARPFFPEDIRRRLEQVEAPRILITTPLHLCACMRSGQHFPSLQYIVSATAPLSASLACQAETFYDTQVLEIFGFTEAGSIASRHTTDSEEWHTYDGIFLGTVNGSLVVEGGHLSAPVPVNDIIELRDAQRFVLRERNADLINIAGKRVSLSDLNHKLLQVSGVIDGVFFMPDESGEPVTRPMAFAVAPGATAAGILAELRQYIDPVFLPRPLILFDALPRNAVGKLPREALIKLAADPRPHGRRPSEVKSMNQRLAPTWLAQPERGSRVTMRVITWITLSLGYTTGRILLYPICLYFLTAFSGRARRASRDFLRRILRRRVGMWDLFRHYHTFASTIYDRVYLLTGRLRHFNVRLEGVAALEEALRAGRGCILLGSHLGSFELLRAKGLFERKLPIRVLMYEDNTQKLNSVLHGLNPQIRNTLIPLGRPDTLLRVKEALDQGEIVGILADRAMPGETLLPCTFLGEDALFPEGPFLLAHILQAPVVLFFGLHLRRRHYAVHFEPLPLLPRATNRGQAARTLAERYVRRLEHYARIAPYNWFNFYDFWHRDTA